MPERIETSEGARALAARIMAARQRPLVVVSTTTYEGSDVAFDVARLESEVDGLADVVLLTTGEVSREFELALPEKLQVYGGAGRSYPIDIGIDPDIRRSPLRFPERPEQPVSCTDLLISDAMTHAYDAGLTAGAGGVRGGEGIRASGRVMGSVAGRTMVRLESGAVAGIVQELVWPWVPFEWVVRRDQPVAGRFHEGSRHLDLDLPTVGVDEVEHRFPHRSVTLALVRDVHGNSATLYLHPSFNVRIGPRDVSSNPLDRIELLLAPGDVVRVRVLHLSVGVHLQLLDVDDSELVLPPLPAIPGGEPWLEEDRPLRRTIIDASITGPDIHLLEAPLEQEVVPRGAPGAIQAEQSAAAPVTDRPIPGPGLRNVAGDSTSRPKSPPSSASLASTPGRALHDTQRALEGARARNLELERRLAGLDLDDASQERFETALRRERDSVSALKRDLADAMSENAALKADLSAVKRVLRERSRERPAESTSERKSSRRDRWIDERGWIKHEIYLAWVERIAPTDRARYPLPTDYVIGRRFADSMASLDDAQFDKALKAVVDVVTGRARDIPSREIHPLRHGESGNAPPIRRDSDGALCYRVYIEQNTPSARRLHYWQPEHGPIELARVVTHDVVAP